MRSKTFLHLYDFAANLFGKRCTKLYQNRPSFVEDITKTFWSHYDDVHEAYSTTSSQYI